MMNASKNISKMGYQLIRQPHFTFSKHNKNDDFEKLKKYFKKYQHKTENLFHTNKTTIY